MSVYLYSVKLLNNEIICALCASTIFSDILVKDDAAALNEISHRLIPTSSHILYK